MRRRRQTGLAIAAAILVALAPSRPAFADAITRVKGKILDNHGKPLANVTIYFEAVEIKKRVGPLHTSKQGEFFIATLDTSVAKKWRVVPDLSGYKTVKVTYEIIDSEKNERGSGDVILGTKQEYPELLFALVGDEGRNVVEIVMAKESDFVTAVQEERKKKAVPEGGQVAGNAGNATTGAPAAAAPPASAAVPSGGKEMLQKAKALTDA